MDWYKSEIRFLADLKARLTGSPSQNTLIDHIQSQLELMNAPVYTDILNFTYDKPLGKPRLVVAGEEIHVSSTLPYSGNTGADGVSGKLVNIMGHSSPPWAEASGAIAVINATVVESHFADNYPVWPGNKGFPEKPAIPLIESFGQEGAFPSLAAPIDAGVTAIICVWENVTVANSNGQYIFGRLYSGLPVLFVPPTAAHKILSAAESGDSATMFIPGKPVSDTKTRTIWTVFEGTKYKNESVILNTHTDGTNALEENGHLALLARAYNLTMAPPERTTVIVFATGHFVPAFSPLLAMGRWLEDNPDYWKGGPGQMKCVVASCAEHLGALNFDQGVPTDGHTLTNKTYVELLFANTQELDLLTKKVWHGARDYTRVVNPIPIGTQFGEGLAYFANGIPEVSLGTLPPYLLVIFPPGFDETSLIDLLALQRQVDSFGRLWDAFDVMPTAEFGQAPANLTSGF